MPPFIPFDTPEPYLFPAGWKMSPIYAWRAYTNPVQSIVSTVANPRPLSDIPPEIVAMVWYQEPRQLNAHKTLDYGDQRPYIFQMPDGTTRTNASSMGAVAYEQLVNRLWTNDTFPTTE